MKYIVLSLSFLLSISLSAQLIGQYTIDKTQPTKKKNYNSFQEAITDLKIKGISGDVTFMVKPRFYDEFLNFESVNPASAHNITFQPSTDDKIRMKNDAMAMVLFNSSGITFNNFEFDSRTSSYSSVILMDNASNIKFYNCLVSILSNTEKDLPMVSMKNSGNCTFEKSRFSGSFLFKNMNVYKNSFIDCAFTYTTKLSEGNFSEEAGLLNCRANGKMLEDNLEIAESANALDMGENIIRD